jgi:hypothetical protein
VSESEDLREFIREITQRFERTTRDQIRQMREDGLRAQREHGVIIDELLELREESRAQRGALLALIDEMRGGGPAPAT